MNIDAEGWLQILGNQINTWEHDSSLVYQTLELTEWSPEGTVRHARLFPDQAVVSFAKHGDLLWVTRHDLTLDPDVVFEIISFSSQREAVEWDYRRYSGPR